MGVVIFFVCAFLWCANIVQIFTTAVAGLAIMKAIGIIFFPLGIVLGLVGLF